MGRVGSRKLGILAGRVGSQNLKPRATLLHATRIHFVFAKAGMIHSVRGWTRGCSGESVKFLDNACLTGALLRGVPQMGRYTIYGRPPTNTQGASKVNTDTHAPAAVGQYRAESDYTVSSKCRSASTVRPAADPRLSTYLSPPEQQQVIWWRPHRIAGKIRTSLNV